MVFRELKQNYIVHALFKGEDSLKFTTGKVVNISEPHFENPQQTFGQYPTQYGGQQNKVVDVTIEMDGSTKTYTMPENSTFVYAGNLVLSTGKEAIIREAEVLMSQSEEALSKIEFHQKRKEQCKQFLASSNPALQEKEAIDKRFKTLESTVGEIKSDLKTLLEKLA